MRTRSSLIHPRGELTPGQWDEWTVFCQVATGFSPALWGFGQDGSSWGQWGLGSTWTGHGGKKGGQEWGQFGCTNEEPHGTDHHCPMAPSIFWGPGQPLGWANWGLAWQWGSQDLSQMRENKGLPSPGPLHRCAKVQKGSIWREQLGRDHASLGWVGERCAPGQWHQEEERGHPKPPAQVLTWADPARASRS